MCKLEIIVRIC